MKSRFVIIFLVTGVSGFSQKYALIDRDFKKPILFTDSVTVSQVSKNYFPIRRLDIDSVLANCNYLISELQQLQRAKFKDYKICPTGASMQPGYVCWGTCAGRSKAVTLNAMHKKARLQTRASFLRQLPAMVRTCESQHSTAKWSTFPEK